MDMSCWKFIIIELIASSYFLAFHYSVPFEEWFVVILYFMYVSHFVYENIRIHAHFL